VFYGGFGQIYGEFHTLYGDFGSLYGEFHTFNGVSQILGRYPDSATSPNMTTIGYTPPNPIGSHPKLLESGGKSIENARKLIPAMLKLKGGQLQQNACYNDDSFLDSGVICKQKIIHH